MRNSFRDWVLGIAGVLAVAGVLGGVKAIADQATLEQKVEANEKELEQRRAKVELVPVIQLDIAYIKGDISKILSLLEEEPR